jgi:hypothetical protein
MGRIWALAGYRRRTVPAGARVHASVRDRVAQEPAYGKRLPAAVEWVDDAWQTPVDLTTEDGPWPRQSV